MNLSRGFEFSAISISLWEKGLPILGVVQHLFTGQVFSSCKKLGAWLNEKELYISSIKNKSEAILATGFPSGSSFSKHSINEFVLNVKHYKKVRMLGSAALMLSYVASGIFDVYHEKDIYIWDVAAGLALISEAGGDFSITQGSSIFKYNVIAANKILLKKIIC